MLGALAAAILVASCSDGQILDAYPKSSGCTLADGQPILRRWNAESAVLLADYIDQSVSADEYLFTSDSQLPKLESVVSDLSKLSNCLPAEAQAFFSQMLSSYNRKLTAYAALGNGIRIGSAQMESDAIKSLEAANGDSLALACQYLSQEDQSLLGLSSC